MIEPGDFSKTILENNLGPIIQVPCSYFKDLLSYLFDTRKIEVISPVNEAIAIGIASGYYLSTQKIPVLILQNSGFLNTLNALTSLNQIYEIPLLYLISWRGETLDAPEHLITGKNLLKTLKTMSVPFKIINQHIYQKQIKELKKTALKYKKPVALIIKKNTFAPYYSLYRHKNDSELTRYQTIKIVKNKLKRNFLFISSTGYPSRDSFFAKNTPDFYMMGSMGHTLPMALGISQNTTKRIVVLDGDGSAMMHLGTLASYSPSNNKNLIYIVLNNQIYDSTGGQINLSANINYSLLAQAFNFKKFYSVSKKEDLIKVLNKVKQIKGAIFIHILLNQTNQQDSPRVSEQYSCPQIKNLFINNLKK